jgi:hypothetical protein
MNTNTTIVPASDYMRFLEELDAFDPKWQQHYTSMEQAAAAGGLTAPMFMWLRHTAEGKRRCQTLAGVPDLFSLIEHQAAVYKEWSDAQWRLLGHLED